MRKVGFSIILLSVFGCSETIQSNKSKDFNGRIKRFYAVIKVADNTRKFVSNFSASLKEGLKQRGVDITVEVLNPMAFETEKSLIKRVSESGSDGLLIINQVESVTKTDPNTYYIGGQTASGGSFDMKIVVPNYPQPVWRGSMKAASGRYGNISAVSKSSANQIIQKLVRDRII